MTDQEFRKLTLRISPEAEEVLRDLQPFLKTSEDGETIRKALGMAYLASQFSTLEERGRVIKVLTASGAVKGIVID